jgi:hypothetical protein
MSEGKRENVDGNSAEFKQGVEAGLNSEADTKNWKAGNELGRELRTAGETGTPVYARTGSEMLTPLFLRDNSEGLKGTAQDEKDGIGE